ncbi:MAG TPA: dihydrolipoamide acetyltransferase [Anaeromyxobacter sp.]
MVRYLTLAALFCTALPGIAVAQTGGAPAAGAPAAGAAKPAVGAEEQNELKVRTLEERVSDLKEKIFRTKARLMNLQEMVIGGDITTGSKAVLVHRNEMGSSFYLESVAYALDGAPIYTKVDVDGDLEKREEFEIFNGRIVPGNHQISVQLVYRGHGYGLFSYLEGYKFKVQSSYAFNAEPGKVNTIKVVGFEKGGLTAELKDRPAVRYDVDVQREENARRTAPADAEGTRR